MNQTPTLVRTQTNPGGEGVDSGCVCGGILGTSGGGGSVGGMVQVGEGCGSGQGLGGSGEGVGSRRMRIISAQKIRENLAR